MAKYLLELFSLDFHNTNTHQDCKSHTQHKVTQYKAGKVRLYAPLYPDPEGFRDFALVMVGLTPSSIPGLPLRAGQTPIRPQAIRVRWPDQTGIPQKSQDDEEGGAAAGMCEMQDQESIGVEEMQTF